MENQNKLSPYLLPVKIVSLFYVCFLVYLLTTGNNGLNSSGSVNEVAIMWPINNNKDICSHTRSLHYTDIKG
jgi:hypothetical protein